jgi:hypothetical protein
MWRRYESETEVRRERREEGGDEEERSKSGCKPMSTRGRNIVSKGVNRRSP